MSLWLELCKDLITNIHFEKFLARLPTLLWEKVRNQIRENYWGTIPYEKLTYDELISFTQKEGLKICQDLK